jgi:hypothetical protein
MRYLAVLLLLAGCSESKPKPILTGMAELFIPHEAEALRGTFAVENSYVLRNGQIVALYDHEASGNMRLAGLDAEYSGALADQLVISDAARFSYVIEHQGGYLNFVTRASKVHMLSSSDLITWHEQGMVLDNDASPSALNHQQWNAAVAYDSTDTGHMLVESGSAMAGQGDVRLRYYQTSPGLQDFSLTSVPDIIGGGNAWVTYIEGQGLLAIYGAIDGGNGPHWIIRAAILPNGDSAWQELPREAFSIAVPGMHIADPHLIETPDGRVLLSVSYDQQYTWTYISESKLSFVQLFDALQAGE